MWLQWFLQEQLGRIRATIEARIGNIYRPAVVYHRWVLDEWMVAYVQKAGRAFASSVSGEAHDDDGVGDIDQRVGDDSPQMAVAVYPLLNEGEGVTSIHLGDTAEDSTNCLRFRGVLENLVLGIGAPDSGDDVFHGDAH